MYETIINGLSEGENGEYRNKYEHSSPFSFGNMVFYPFWVGLGPILGPLGHNFGVTDDRECLKLLQLDSVGWKMRGI